MRAGLVVAFVAVALAFGPSVSAGVFPDLPGVDMLEEATGNNAPQVASTSGSAPQPQDRVPAPDPTSPDPAETVSSAATPEQIQVITSMPGGSRLPILKDAAGAASRESSDAPLVLLVVAVVVLFTRFLVRLNDL